MKTSIKHTIIAFFIGALALSSCKKDKTSPQDEPGYSVPTTYNFSSVDYSGQTIRMTMLDSIASYMSTGGTGVVLDANHMKAMYSNTGNPFGNTVLDASGKQLKNKTFVLDQMYFEDLFDSLAVASQSAGAAASNGVAGISGGRLFDRHGVELAQVIKKQLMGAVFYYQAIETYFANLPNDDNSVVNVDGTAQEHHADEAFGYFGAPIDFPSNSLNAVYWAGYSAEVNTAISCNMPIMNGFLKLRAAISNKDDATRNAQVIIVRQQWERIVAASAILELTEAKAAFGTDNAQMRHVLSEGVGFIHSLKYTNDKLISTTQINNAISALGTNFYAITLPQINNAISIINQPYGFDLNAF